jgi:PiT family inorganic phosphate transporter
MLLLVFLAAALVALANGANDNFKGVATLFGSGAASYRSAVTWATLTTFLGSLAALFVASGLAKTFSGGGLVPESMAASPTFVACVAIGAASAVVLATCLAVPVSTTHALMGALVGAGLGMGGTINGSVLGSRFLLPLLVSPLIGMALLCHLAPDGRRPGATGLRLASVTHDATFAVALADASTPIALGPSELHRRPALAAAGDASAEGQTGIDILSGAHFLSAGAVSFARGLNDTPKLLALLLASRVVGAWSGTAMVGLWIAVGGLLGSRRIAETMSRRIVVIDPHSGLLANMVTALVVIFASRFGLPVSTTHVSCGALFGLGSVGRGARRGIVFKIILAWIVTLPLAAVLSGLLAVVLHH